MAEHDTPNTKPIDRSHHNPMESYTFALKLNDLINRNGEMRDNGSTDLAWNSVEIGKYFILIRYVASEEVYFTLIITEHDHDEQGDEHESQIVFSPERGVISMFGKICSEVEIFNDGYGTQFDMAQTLMRMCIDTYVR